MIRSLQSLRAFGAIMIFAHHFAFKDSPITLAFGDYAVVLFFVLSGFVLMLSFDNKECPAPLLFLWNRFKRIAPLYYISILLQLCIMDFDFDWNTLWPTLLMIQSWSADPDVFFGIYGITWFVSSLMFCYLMFPLLRRLLSLPVKHIVLLCIACIAIYGYILYRIPLRLTYYVIYIFPPMQLFPFCIGMLLYRCIGKKSFVLKPYLSDILILLAFTASYIFILGAREIPLKYTLSSYYWVIIALVITIFTITNRSRGLATALAWRPLVKLGNASFAFYLLHLCWIEWSREMMSTLNINLSQGVEFTIGLIILIPASMLIHHLLSPHRL